MKIVFLILNIILIKTIVNAKLAIAHDRLLSDLFTNYNPSSRPAARKEVIEVRVNIELQHFDFRESDGAFNFIGFLNAGWYDKMLKWNPNEYGNITEIAINQKLVWVPDLEMYNNAPDKFLRMQRRGFVVLNNTGNLTWSNSIEVTVFCNTNMRRWPNDQHICHLSLGSWVYDGFDVDLVNDQNMSLSFDNARIKNMDFEITEYSAQRVSTIYSCCEEPYITLKYEIKFKRRPGYSTVLYAPVYTVILFTFLALALKPNRSEKILLNGMNIILIVFQLLYFAQSVGKFARETPYIVKFYSYSLVTATITQLICVFSLWTTRSINKGKVLPLYISKFLKGSLANYIAPNQFIRINVKPENVDSQLENVSSSDHSSLIPMKTIQNQWIQLAIILERIALIVISFVYVLLTTKYLA